MRSKFIPLAVALVFGSIAVVGFSQMMKAGPQLPTVEIYVANRTINAAEEITQDAIQLEQWPADRIPQDAVRDWNELAGKFASQRLFAGEPLLMRKTIDSSEVRSVEIPRGFNVVALSSDEVSSVANLVSPGDRVNVIGFFTRSEVIPETTTKTILRGVRVFAVDGRTNRDDTPDAESKSKSAKTVSLLIHAEDAEVLQWARELARISLTLGRPDDGDNDDESAGPNPAGIAFKQWLQDHSARQAELAAAEQEARNQLAQNTALLTQPTPQTSNAGDTNGQAAPATAEPAEPEIEHRMVKIGPDGRISVYTWEKGNPIPKVTAGDPTVKPQASEATQGAPGNGAFPERQVENLTTTEADLDYLNGAESPLFSTTDDAL